MNELPLDKNGSFSAESLMDTSAIIPERHTAAYGEMPHHEQQRTRATLHNRLSVLGVELDGPTLGGAIPELVSDYETPDRLCAALTAASIERIAESRNRRDSDVERVSEKRKAGELTNAEAQEDAELINERFLTEQAAIAKAHGIAMDNAARYAAAQVDGWEDRQHAVPADEVMLGREMWAEVVEQVSAEIRKGKPIPEALRPVERMLASVGRGATDHRRTAVIMAGDRWVRRLKTGSESAPEAAAFIGPVLQRFKVDNTPAPVLEAQSMLAAIKPQRDRLALITKSLERWPAIK